MWTKKRYVESALEEIGIASYQFDISPEMSSLVLKRLDSMMATWNAKGIRLNYNLSNNPLNSTLDDEVNIPDFANEAVYTNLALRLASSFGKQVSQELKNIAFSSFNTLYAKSFSLDEKQFDRSIPAGQGNKLRRTYSPFLIPIKNTPSDTDGNITFN